MGAVRKTGSIFTLGLVDFRTRAERLARAEAKLGVAEASMASATERAERAQRRAEKAEAKALSLSGSRRQRRRAAKARIVAEA